MPIKYIKLILKQQQKNQLNLDYFSKNLNKLFNYILSTSNEENQKDTA